MRTWYKVEKTKSEPLLPPRRRRIFQRRLAFPMQLLADWWAVTTSRTYLASPLSRRAFWKFMFPVCWLSDVAADVIEGSLELPWSQRIDSNMYATWTWLLVAFACAWLPHQSLLSDAVLAALMVVYEVISSRYFSPELATHAGNLLWISVVLNVNGIHGSMVIASCLSYAIFVWQTIGDPESFLWMVYILPLLALDYNCGSLYKAWETQRVAIENLLDMASSGFGSIDCSTGLVSHASAELADTFATSNLVGRAFVDYIEGMRTWAELLAHCTSAEGKLQPVLVTCCTRSGQGRVSFEAKLIPYAASDSLVSLCVQVIGEKRVAALLERQGTIGTISESIGVDDSVSVRQTAPAPAASPPPKAPASRGDAAGAPGSGDVAGIPDPSAAGEVVGIPDSSAAATKSEEQGGCCGNSLLTYSQSAGSKPGPKTDVSLAVSKGSGDRRESKGQAGGARTDVSLAPSKSSWARSGSPAEAEVSWALSSMNFLRPGGDSRPPEAGRAETEVSLSLSAPPPASSRQQRRESNGAGAARPSEPNGALGSRAHENGFDHSADASRRVSRPPAFRKTPRRTCALWLTKALQHWDIPHPSGTCCFWHAYLDEATEVLKELDRVCDFAWGSLQGWQCEECLLLNDPSQARCALCNAEAGVSRFKLAL